MARGRNHNRNRNQQNQSTQQQLQHQHQKPKHLIYQQQQQQHPQLSGCQMQQMQSTNASDAPVAVIYQEAGSGNDEAEIGGINGGNQHISDQPHHTPSTNVSESYGHNNKSNNYENHDDDRSDGHSNDVPAANVIPSPADSSDGIAIKTHLEMNGDPSTTTTATHTYQMTMSNNSHTDFSQNKINTTGHNTLPTQQQDASNSAKEHMPPLPTENTKQEENSGRTSSSPSSSSALQPREESEHERDEQNLSNNSGHSEQYRINRSPVIEHSVSSVIAAQVTQNNDQRLANNRDGQLNQVTTVCDQNRVNQTTTTATTSTTMGQKNTKGGEMSPSSSSAHLREFRESSLPPQNNGNNKQQSPGLPTITVSDCSTATTNTTTPLYPQNTPRGYYDLEQNKQEFNDHNNSKTSYGTNKESEGGPNGASSLSSGSTSSSYRSPSPTSMYSQMRYNYVKLEDVPEQEEEEYEEDADNDDDTDEGNETDEGAAAKTQQQNNKFTAAQHHVATASNLDNEFQQRKNSASLSPDRQRYAHSIDINHSNNSTDSNLSTSYPDSGMGESIASTNGRSSTTPTMSHHMKHQQQQQYHHQQHFIRDGSSTDCDETLTHCEELIDFVDTTTEFLDPNERLVCIESISLPDVVVESTNSCGNTSSSSNPSSSSSSNNATSDSASGEERDIININGATGNAMGNVHFIPIHVEGSGSGGRTSPRKQSVDDSVVGSGKATIEIIEDVTELHPFNNKNDLKAEHLK
ncbi:transcription factor mef2A-like [Musca vetustissima]|uniref:transcription factor mef2A-like n=1 Tax=Musca vetustissima TaxID=27455 RepID=UPI002AB6382F|nr:transcription factor mef2A-like [Musca vetustissima]